MILQDEKKIKLLKKYDKIADEKTKNPYCREDFGSV